MPPAPAYSDKAVVAKLEGTARQLEKRLKEYGSHSSKTWTTSVHPYPPAPAPPEVYTLQVFRPTWFNQEGQGIHFETFIGPKEWKKKQIQIAMHIFHVETIPGTNLKRRAVAVPFVDEIYERVSRWEGYTFRTGKYGTHPFTKILPFEYENFEAQLSGELLRICLELGPVMDQTLASVLSRSSK